MGAPEGQGPTQPPPRPYPEPPVSAPQYGPHGAGGRVTPSASSGLQPCLRTTGAEGPPAEEERAGSQATKTQSRSFTPRTRARPGAR